MPRSVRNRVRAVATAIVLLASASVFSGCGLFAGGPNYDLAGTYTGGVTLQGQAINGDLEITQSGYDLTAAFSAPSMGLQAEGEGRVSDEGTVVMELGYDLECPGTARLSGRVRSDGRRLSGNVEATDCTGTVSGTFSFTRR